MKKKFIFLIFFLVLVLITASFLIINRTEKEGSFIKNEEGSFYKEEGLEVLDIYFGNENNPTKVTFKVNNAGVSYNLPDEVNWFKNEKGNIEAKTGLETFRYSFIREKGKVIGIKAEMILKDSPKHNVYTFDMNLEGAKRERNISSRDFYDKNNNLVFYMEKPSMTDQKENKSEDINLRITNSQIALVPSKEWLGKEEREYPVVIDFSFKVADSIIEEKTKD